tara:strand:- start:4809 stop:6293 length:1485 start_codon:yes stop_codon:yes gene_type:complete
MAKKQTQTAALDAGAMYQIGAAGAGGATKSGEKSGTSMLSQLGRYAIGLYMQAGENNKQSRRETTGLFAQLEATALDSGIALPHIDAWKAKLNEANSAINSVRGKLLPDSPVMIKAYEDREKVLSNLQNASNEFENFGPKKDYALSLVNRTYVVGKDTENEARVGFGQGSTSLEIYNSSLLANGSIEKALDYDEDGFLVVHFGEDSKPFGESWDNPNTEKVETEEDFTSAYKEVGTKKDGIQTIRLKDMEWATHANPNQENHSNSYIGKYISNGSNGKVASADEMSLAKLELASTLDKLNNDPRAMVNYLFQGNTWTGEENGEPKLMSLAEGLINQEVHGLGEGASNLITAAKEDGVIDNEELMGIREAMKQNILEGNYSTEALTEMIHNKAVSSYGTEMDSFEEEKESNETTVVKKGKDNYNNFRAVHKNYGNRGTSTYSFTFAGYDWVETGLNTAVFETKSGGVTGEFSFKALHQKFNGDYVADKYFERSKN